MKKCKSAIRRLRSLSAVLAGSALGLALAGCVSNMTNNGTGSASSQASHYFGTANPVNDETQGPPYWSGGVWSITLDTVTNYFSYNDINSQSSTKPGQFPLTGTSGSTPSGFLDLTLYQGTPGSGGYAMNLPGEGLLLRTGSSTQDALGASPSAVIGAVVSNACPTFSSAKTFNFIAEGTTFAGDPTPHVAYGSFQITPSGTGSWGFSKLNMYTLGGTSLSPTPFADATCATSPQGFVLVSPLSITPRDPGASQITVGISPSGLLAIDQGQNEGFEAISDSEKKGPGATGPLGLLGVMQSSAALNVSDMVGKTYAGFESDPLGPLGTIAVAFGSKPGTGTAIIGGGFPKDDATQQPHTNTTLDLGSQSTQTPGLFTQVTLTQPDGGSCAGTPSGGTDSQGNPTCIFHGVAVAGQVAGKYVIFSNISEPTAATSGGLTPLAVINVVLYQQ